MKSNPTRELQLRVSDLEEALKAIGRILADETVAAQKRLNMAAGIVFRYDTPEVKP
jgi:hypothetical protein